MLMQPQYVVSQPVTQLMLNERCDQLLNATPIDIGGQYRGTFLVPVPSVLWKSTGTAVPVLLFLNF